MVGVFLSGGFIGSPSLTEEGRTLPVTELGICTVCGVWNPGLRYTEVPVMLRLPAPEDFFLRVLMAERILERSS